jgi:hypothetical protein
MECDENRRENRRDETARFNDVQAAGKSLYVSGRLGGPPRVFFHRRVPTVATGEQAYRAGDAPDREPVAVMLEWTLVGPQPRLWRARRDAWRDEAASVNYLTFVVSGQR